MFHKGITITDARSYGGNTTPSDHKLVIMDCIIKWPYSTKHKSNPIIDIDNIQNDIIKQTFKDEVTQMITNTPPPNNHIEKWQYISTLIKKAATNTLGIKPKKRFIDNN